MAKSIGVTGIYAYKDGRSWFYKAMIDGKRVPAKRFPCPLLAQLDRFKVLEANRQFTFKCLDCGKSLIVEPAKWKTRNPRRCKTCALKRQRMLTKARRKKSRSVLKTEPLIKIVYNIKQRSCLKCNKMFESLHTHNRVCIKCANDRDCDRRSYRAVMR